MSCPGGTSRPHSAFRILLFPSLIFFLSSCASPRYRGPGTLVEFSGVQEQLVTNLQQRYPQSFRLKQRLALHALGKQYDMLGYLVVGADGALRAVALGEMGGRIFDLALEQGEAKIHKKPDKMPPKPLLDGVIGDLRHLYTLPPLDSPRSIGVSVERGLSLALTSPDMIVSEFSFRIQDHELVRSREARGRRVLREAEYADYRKLDNCAVPIPTRIYLTNYRWHYALEIQTLELIPQ